MRCPSDAPRNSARVGSSAVERIELMRARPRARPVRCCLPRRRGGSPRPKARPGRFRPRPGPRLNTRARWQILATSSKSVAITRMARPRARAAASSAIDLGLGAHINARRRLLQDQQLFGDLEPAGDHDLLLVAAGEGLRRPGRIVRAARRTGRTVFLHDAVRRPVGASRGPACRSRPDSGTGSRAR